MKRRQLFPLLVGGSTAFTALGFLQKPAHATFLNDLLDGALGETAPTGSSSNPTVYSTAPASAPVQDSTIFAEVYGENYITRKQFAVLQSGGAVHWWDIAPKPYARIKSDDGLERYYFPFSFGEGGAIVVCDTTGLISNWDIAGDSLVPEYSPDDLSKYNYYPPREVAAATNPGYPPPPPAAPVSNCY